MDAIQYKQFRDVRNRNVRFFIYTVLIFLLFSTPILSENNMLRLSLKWLGFILIIVGVIGRIYCSAFIGGRNDQHLISVGPFAHIRNPLYALSFLGLVGVSLQSGMLIITVMTSCIFYLYYSKTVSVEEKYLTNRFGDDFLKYKSIVPRWFNDQFS